VRKPVGGHEAVYSLQDVFMARDVVEGVGTIFFNPGQRDTLTLVKSSGEVVYHGEIHSGGINVHILDVRHVCGV